MLDTNKKSLRCKSLKGDSPSALLRLDIFYFCLRLSGKV
jgi:hypothetical protein